MSASFTRSLLHRLTSSISLEVLELIADFLSLALPERPATQWEGEGEGEAVEVPLKAASIGGPRSGKGGGVSPEMA